MGRHDRHGIDTELRSERSGQVRSRRLEELIREEINSLLDGELQDPELEGVSITLVELARDGSRARLWFRCASSGDDGAERALERAAGYLRVRLCESLELKRVPELRVRRDPTSSSLESE